MPGGLMGPTGVGCWAGRMADPYIYDACAFIASRCGRLVFEFPDVAVYPRRTDRWGEKVYTSQRMVGVTCSR